MKNQKYSNKYTCNEYRAEMILLALQRKLASDNITPEEKDTLLAQIAKLEKQMGID